MDESAFQALLKRHEGETVDFKQSAYDFTGDEQDKKRAQFIKDIISMYNTPRDEPSYIVLGVEKHLDGSYTLKGITDHVDDAELQDKISPCVYPTPKFAYEPVRWQEIQFAVIVIPPNHETGPCLPIRDVGGQVLRQHQLYIRRGSKNEAANWDEQRRVFAWFEAGHDARYVATGGDQAWNAFAAEAGSFSSDYHYALVTRRLSPDPDAAISNLSRIGWAFVMDFDPATDVDGLLAQCRAELSSLRSLHLVVRNDKPSINLDRGTYWYCARGLQGRDSTLVSSPKWVDWNRVYGNELRNQMLSYAAASASRPLILIAIWDESENTDYLDSVLGAATSAFGEAVRILIVSPNESASLATLAGRYEASLFVLPLHQFCHGLSSIVPESPAVNHGDVILPSSSGAPVTITANRLAWLSEELDIVHKATGTRPPADRSPGRDFLRGNEITWYDLGLGYDIQRDASDRLLQTIRDALQKRRAFRVNLFHEPGAGGTTLAKRIVWNCRHEFPCVMLRRTSPAETCERLTFLSTLTGMPVLVAVDAGAVSDREADSLYDYLSAAHVPAVIFQVVRRLNAPDGVSSKKSTWLQADLSDVESDRFVHFLAREEPTKSQAIREALKDPYPGARTPFYLALVAFEKDFVRLREYVQVRLSALTEVQRRCVGYLAIAHLFGQRTIPSQTFASLFGLPTSRPIDVTRLLPEVTFGLLAEPSPHQWRTAHALIAEECMAQLFVAPNHDPELWRQSLSQWTLDFIDVCRGNTPVPTEEGLDLVRRVCVYRDNSEMLGYERAGSKQFARVIDAIPSTEGRLQVLKRLTEAFPDEAHFWAHLGRFYSFELQEYDNAIDAVNHSITLQSEDHVLYHMKGMVLRGQLYQMISEKRPVGEVIEVAQQATTAFTEARRLNPEDEHGYISEAQMIVRVLDYAGTQAGSDSLTAATSQTSPKWLRESLQTAEHLLAQVRQNREGEPPSHYEEGCLAAVQSVYGKYSDALQKWDNVLSRKDVYRPPIRRQIVWTYLARCDRRWDKLAEKDVQRAVRLLEENLQEEPNDERNLRLWLRGIRQLTTPPSLEAIIEKVAYWRANSESLEPVYYLYVLYGVKALDGYVLARDEAERVLEECRSRARFRRNRTRSFEWIGKGEGLARLVHVDRLGEWDRDAEFWKDTEGLERVGGVVAKITGPEAGVIETEGGLRAFYVPAKAGHHKGMSESSRVTFFLGFSYEGPRAWSVQDATS